MNSFDNLESLVARYEDNFFFLLPNKSDSNYKQVTSYDNKKEERYQPVFRSTSNEHCCWKKKGRIVKNELFFFLTRSSVKKKREEIKSWLGGCHGICIYIEPKV